MMKPGIGAYDRFKELFDRYSRRSGQGAVPDPVLHRRAPRHDRRGHAEPRAVAQAQRLPARPGAGVLAVADGERDRDVSHRRIRRCARCVARDRVHVVKGLERRRLHKAFLRYHDPENWPVLREALRRMGRSDLIGSGKQCLVPSWQPATGASRRDAARATRSSPESRSHSTPVCQPLSLKTPRARA